MKALLAGWFSFSNGHATAGDLLVRDVVGAWLGTAGMPYDVALAPPFTGGVDILTVDSSRYSHLVFVCGPFERGGLEAQLLTRFSHCRLVGVNLSMQVPLNAWDPFDFLIERDSSRGGHADVVFVSNAPRVPVIGICRVEPHPGAMDACAHAAVDRLIGSREMSVVEIDTRLDVNSGGLRSPGEIECLIARMDVVVTTRLHGMVMALKNGVPAIAIDPIAGGAKIRRQASTIDWPLVFDVDDVNDEVLREALDYCLTDAAREDAARCAGRSRRRVDELGKRFVRVLSNPEVIERNYAVRTAAEPDTAWMERFREDIAEHAPEARNGTERTPVRRFARWFRRASRALSVDRAASMNDLRRDDS